MKPNLTAEQISKAINDTGGPTLSVPVKVVPVPPVLEARDVAAGAAAAAAALVTMTSPRGVPTAPAPRQR